MKLGKWMTVTEVPNEGRKTKRWIVTGSCGTQIGQVYWETGWRQYVFASGPPADFSASCLCHLAEFLDQVNDEQKGESHEHDSTALTASAVSAWHWGNTNGNVRPK